MIDNQITRYIQNCRAILKCPAQINEQFCRYYSKNQIHNVNDFILDQITQQYYVNRNCFQSIRYLYLIDFLIKKSLPLPSSFINIFVSCFSFFYYIKEISRVKQLVQLLKEWVPYVKPIYIAEMKKRVSQIAKDDLRKRQTSQRENSRQEYLQEKPLTKKVKKEKNSAYEKAREMINKLRQNFNYCCKECGKYFNTSSLLQLHKKQHFELRMHKFKSIRKKLHRNKAGKVEWQTRKWINKNITSIVIETIHAAKWDSQQSCVLCHQQFQSQFKYDSWIIKGAICCKDMIVGLQLIDNKIQHDKQLKFVHIKCFQLLNSPECQETL